MSPKSTYVKEEKVHEPQKPQKFFNYSVRRERERERKWDIKRKKEKRHRQRKKDKDKERKKVETEKERESKKKGRDREKKTDKELDTCKAWVPQLVWNNFTLNSNIYFQFLSDHLSTQDKIFEKK